MILKPPKSFTRLILSSMVKAQPLSLLIALIIPDVWRANISMISLFPALMPVVLLKIVCKVVHLDSRLLLLQRSASSLLDSPALMEAAAGR